MKVDVNLMQKWVLTALYAQMETTVRLKDIFFTDTTENYVTPSEPKLNDEVTIRIKSSRQTRQVTIVINGERYVMKYGGIDERKYHIYEHKFILKEKIITYYYEIHTRSNKHYVYDYSGLKQEHDPALAFKIVADYKTPDWAKGAVMYQIYVDRFYNGDKTNDVLTHEYKYLGKPVKKLEWDQPVEEDDVRNFYGGDLQGVIDKLDYLEDLGVEAIYFNPLFVSPSNHKYDAQDYDYIDPHIGVIVEDEGSILEFGKMKNKYATKYISRTTNKKNLEASNELFIKLVELAHARNIKVIVDGVFNHCGAYNKWLDKGEFYEAAGYPTGAYKSEDSKYKDYFVWDKVVWPNNEEYSSWWGHKNHPKLNFEGSKELEDYIMSVAKKWVSPPYNCDGWRLDVAADLGLSEKYNHKFWKRFRDVVKKANPEAIIISEHYGDPSKWLEGDEWDTIMNYDAFMEPVTWFLTGMEKHSEDFSAGMLNNHYNFAHDMNVNGAKLATPALFTAMNQLSNHDHSRFLTRTNQRVGRLHTLGKELADADTKMSVMFEAIILQMTWPGAPTLYYGDEIGMKGWTDPDNRRTFDWDNIDENILSFYKEVIKIHKENIALKKGSLKKLYADYGVLCYGRWYQDNSIIVIVNNQEHEKRVSVATYHLAPLGMGKAETLIRSFEDGTYSTDRTEYNIHNNEFVVTMPPRSAKIMRIIQ